MHEQSHHLPSCDMYDSRPCRPRTAPAAVGEIPEAGHAAALKWPAAVRTVAVPQSAPVAHALSAHLDKLQASFACPKVDVLINEYSSGNIEMYLNVMLM